MDTLLLNKDASPLSVLPLSAIGWQEAIKYVWLNRVQVLEWYDDWLVRSPSWETRVPAVMIVKEYVKPKKFPSFNKYNITLRDRFICQYCETNVSMKTVTMDHVLPMCRGGKTNWENIVAACGACNSRKGNNTHIKPIRLPYRPTYYELVNIRKELPFDLRHPSWKNYLQ
jgi:5-methylcytosine-specific restriction endonuclease McrA